jgi:hypothetical protein
MCFVHLNYLEDKTHEDGDTGILERVRARSGTRVHDELHGFRMCTDDGGGCRRALHIYKEVSVRV